MVFNSPVITHIVESLGNENLVLAPMVDSLLNTDNDKALAIKIGESALAEVNVFKNTYNSTMFNFIEKVKGYVEAGKEIDLASKYSIFEVNNPELLKILKENNYFKDVNDFEELDVASLIIPAPTDIKQYLYSQNTIIASELELLKTRVDEEFLKNTWNSIFTNLSSSNNDLDYFYYGGINKLDSIIAAMGMVDYIIEHCEVGDTRITNSQISNVKKFKYNLFVSLSRMSNEYDRNSDTGLLITDVKTLPNGVVSLFVDETNYNKFLTEGGTVETLLGFFLTKFISPTNHTNIYTSILEDKERYISQFTEAVKSDKIRIAVQANDKVRTYYSIALSEMFREMSNEITELYVPDVNVAEAVLDDIIINKTRTEQLDIDTVAYELFSNIAVLPNYKKYMSTMADISKSNPELDPKECASLAFVDMVINFVLDQVNVVKYDKIQGTISPAAIAL